MTLAASFDIFVFHNNSPWLVVLGVLVGLLLILVLLHQFKLVTISTASPRKILAVGAHPDDLELACGATLARLIDEGHEVHTLIMSRGEVGGDPAIRASEARLGASMLGAASVVVHDFPDTNLDLASREMTKAIEASIVRVGPSVIFTHSSHDQHQDHHAVHLATLRAGRSHHSILCFESPSVTKDFAPTVFFDVEDYMDVKVEAVALHRDQISGGKRYMTRDVLAGTAAFRGHQVKCRRAEAFEAVRLMPDTAGIF
ncbi:MAG: PIG-L deacetylase family protein [Dermatophilus congolensis]|nr:PIG-L deacetylase family protein [Dermatophilus congolensis]